MKSLFDVMIFTCVSSDTKEFWEKHKEDLCKNIFSQITIIHPGIEIDMNDQIAIIAFYNVEEKVMNLAQKKLEEFGMAKANREAGSLNRKNLKGIRI